MAGPENTPLPDLPDLGESPWYAKRAEWDAEVARRLVGKPAFALVVVTTGNEPRPDAEFVMWLGGVNEPANMANADVHFSTSTVIVVPPTGNPPVITTTTLNAMQVGSPYSQVIQYNGDTATAASVLSGSLPTGLSVTLTGGVVRIQGTPTVAVGFSVVIQVFNSSGSDTQALGGSVSAAPTTPTAPEIQTTTLPALTQGVAASQSITATGTTPITYARTAGALPAGMTLTSAGLFSGTPTGTGAYSFTVTATNSVSTDTQVFSGTVAAAPAGPGNYVNPTLPAGSYNVFGAVAPPGIITTDSSAPSTLRVGNRFYTTHEGGLSLVGARIWNPVGAPAGFLAADVTVYAYLETWSGGTVLGTTTYAGTPERTKAITGIRQAGTWSEILFDTPITLPKIASGAADALVTIAVNMTGGWWASDSAGLSDGANISNVDVHLAEQQNVGRAVTNNNPGDNGFHAVIGGIYLTDLIVDAL